GTTAPEALQRRPDLGGVRLSSPDRVIDRQSGTTKEQLAAYYAEVIDLLLPHLADRPVSLVRAPQGVDGKHFFQKHKGTLKIRGVRELDPRIMPGHDPLITIESRQGVIGAVQMNVIEFHTWNGVASRIDQPDRMLFDLDPGEGVEWQQVVEGTEATAIFLEEIGLRSFLKTSGGKGLHIVVPLQRRYDWDTVKDFSRTIVEHLASIMPDRFVAKSGPRNRVGRIFIDYLRNGRGATTVAAFVVRARPGLGVSMPVTWAQLHELQAGNHWHIGNTLPWLEERKEDPWADYNESAQALGKAMRKLGFRAKK
ncbi:MAG: non-homologous end-joining DNA ligase, partial [Spongiibacteraceae bacterium]|nr:non-homologous end-joining DNA ligase [Spongiibacteraceae bacterium]